MTEQEAKLICDVRISRFDHAEDVNEALEIAKQALEEIQQYRAIGTVEECREAVEKQKPKVGIVTAGKSYPIMCPSCGHKMDLAYHYCVFCGQSLIYLQKHEQAGDQMGE